jgi:hypothetical protein
VQCPWQPRVIRTAAEQQAAAPPAAVLQQSASASAERKSAAECALCGAEMSGGDRGWLKCKCSHLLCPHAKSRDDKRSCIERTKSSTKIILTQDMMCGGETVLQATLVAVAQKRAPARTGVKSAASQSKSASAGVIKGGPKHGPKT